MISWFSRSRIRKYVTLSKKKQDKVRMGLEERLSTQNELLDSALWEARSKASLAARHESRGNKEKAKDELNQFKLEISRINPVLNSYVETYLELQLVEVMSMDGFELPDTLLEIRNDIDFGLFSTEATDDLATILSTEVNPDPFEELGINI